MNEGLSKRELGIVSVVFAAGFFWLGLFTEYAACIFSGLYALCFSLLVWKRKKISIYVNYESIALLILVCMYLITYFYGIDAGMSLIGFFRVTGILFFLGIVMQCTEENRKSLSMLIPAAGVVMTGVGAISYPITPLRDFFYVTRRLGGFFQYPNVYAIFCLIGMILLMTQNFAELDKKRRLWSRAAVLVLTAGILMSGSRTVFALLMLTIVVFILRYRNMRKLLLILVAAVFVAAFATVAITGSVQHAGRFLTTSLSSSTFLGRILYAKDGLRLIAEHPFGQGYLGYYYLEPEIQTAYYSVRFIHNDILQLILDVGIIPGVLVVAAFVKSIFSKRQPFCNRWILVVIMLHLLMDFDLEFLSMWYLVVLVSDMQYGKEIILDAKKKNVVRNALGLATMGMFVCANIYVGAAMMPRYAGNPELSSELLPFYTESNAEVLAAETSPDAAEKLANKILKQNKYVPEAYDVLATVAYAKGDYREMVENKKHSLNLQKYEMKAFDRYVQLLSQAIAQASQQGNVGDAMYLVESVLEVEEILKATEAKTDPIAYETRDVPDFTLSEESQNYIRNVKEIMG